MWKFINCTLKISCQQICVSQRFSFVFGCGLSASVGNLFKFYSRNWLMWVIWSVGKWTEIRVISDHSFWFWLLEGWLCKLGALCNETILFSTPFRTIWWLKKSRFLLNFQLNVKYLKSKFSMKYLWPQNMASILFLLSISTLNRTLRLLPTFAGVL